MTFNFHLFFPQSIRWQFGEGRRGRGQRRLGARRVRLGVAGRRRTGRRWRPVAPPAPLGLLHARHALAAAHAPRDAAAPARADAQPPAASAAPPSPAAAPAAAANQQHGRRSRQFTAAPQRPGSAPPVWQLFNTLVRLAFDTFFY